MNPFPEGVLGPESLCLQIVGSLLYHVVNCLAEAGRGTDLVECALRVVVAVGVPRVGQHCTISDAGSFLVETDVGGLVGESVALLVHVKTVHLIGKIFAHCVVRILQGTAGILVLKLIHIILVSRCSA